MFAIALTFKTLTAMIWATLRFIFPDLFKMKMSRTLRLLYAAILLAITLAVASACKKQSKALEPGAYTLKAGAVYVFNANGATHTIIVRDESDGMRLFYEKDDGGDRSVGVNIGERYHFLYNRIAETAAEHVITAGFDKSKFYWDDKLAGIPNLCIQSNGLQTDKPYKVEYTLIPASAPAAAKADISAGRGKLIPAPAPALAPAATR